MFCTTGSWAFFHGFTVKRINSTMQAKYFCCSTWSTVCTMRQTADFASYWQQGECAMRRRLPWVPHRAGRRHQPPAAVTPPPPSLQTPILLGPAATQQRRTTTTSLMALVGPEEWGPQGIVLCMRIDWSHAMRGVDQRHTLIDRVTTWTSIWSFDPVSCKPKVTIKCFFEIQKSANKN